MNIGKILYDWHVLQNRDEKCEKIICSFFCIFRKIYKHRTFPSHANSIESLVEPLNTTDATTTSALECFEYEFVTESSWRQSCIITVDRRPPAQIEYCLFHHRIKYFSIIFPNKTENEDPNSNVSVISMKYKSQIKSIIQSCSVSNIPTFSSKNNL